MTPTIIPLMEPPPILLSRFTPLAIHAWLYVLGSIPHIAADTKSIGYIRLSAVSFVDLIHSLVALSVCSWFTGSSALVDWVIYELPCLYGTIITRKELDPVFTHPLRSTIKITGSYL